MIDNIFLNEVECNIYMNQSEVIINKLTYDYDDGRYNIIKKDRIDFSNGMAYRIAKKIIEEYERMNNDGMA